MKTSFVTCPNHGRVAPRKRTEPEYRMLQGRRVEWGTRTVLETTKRGYFKCSVCNFPTTDLITLDVTITDTPCNEACITATGRKCECSCGGENHGA